jgi:uncharacterized membrane protein YkvA (DUF1232 family)
LTDGVHAVVAIVAGLVLAWLGLVGLLAFARPDGTTIGDALRIGAETVRLVVRLARDRSVPRRARVILWLLAAYLLSPIDLVPDFIPVVGYADDLIIASLALRAAVRAASVETVDRHWTGSPSDLAVVHRLAGVT